MSADTTVMSNSTVDTDVRILATEFMMYKVGKSRWEHFSCFGQRILIEVRMKIIENQNTKFYGPIRSEVCSWGVHKKTSSFWALFAKFLSTLAASTNTKHCFIPISCRKWIIFVSGDFINKYYFPVFVPIGVTGNILSFLVSIIRSQYYSNQYV